ncbi:MAG: urea ABC transporter permease subunit UrtB [Shinella sp.]|nr:urea ABC transporter permease subunit UrtB [Shinella sp.]
MSLSGTYRFLQSILAAFCVIVTMLATDLHAQEDVRGMINALGQGNFSAKEKQVQALAKTGDPKIVPALEALAEGDLYLREADGQVFLTRSAGSNFTLIDPLTGEEAGEEAKGALTKVRVNNGLRRTVRAALGALTLLSPDRGIRLQAAQSILKSPSGDSLELVESALQSETDTTVKGVLEEARAAALLTSDRSLEEKKKAIETIKAIGGRGSLSLLSAALSSADENLRPDIEAAIQNIEDRLALWAAGQNIWYGLSLGSVLLLAAIGLAITFGVMGIINMAHGEMVMLGAYTTFVVQEIIRTSFPGLFDWSLAIALPLAFLVTGAVGLALERGVIRFLYGRPLETLLATWGISLILQQAVRTVFGPTNREVGNPSWMSGAFELGGLTVTWNRLWIIVFALAVFAALLFLLKKTPMGLQMRAVTQNRRMASSMGIRTPWVDALTFALGSGIAGIAGVALSQIDNVSPNLGQGYIIDSFMVVVFGGVGNLWGTLVGAFSLGILNKFLEPYAGAVLGKILVLVLIILFIQKRPRGLFALKGRAVEA